MCQIYGENHLPLLGDDAANRLPFIPLGSVGGRIEKCITVRYRGGRVLTKSQGRLLVLRRSPAKADATAPKSLLNGTVAALISNYAAHVNSYRVAVISLNCLISVIVDSQCCGTRPQGCKFGTVPQKLNI